MLPPDYARWRSKFAKVLDPQRYTIEHVDAMVAAGMYLFDHTERAAILTEAKMYPTGAWDVHGVLAAGDLGEIVSVLVPLAEERARKLGAIGAEIASRAGWTRSFRKMGYELEQVMLRKRF